MKSHILMMVALAFAIPLMAQETNRIVQAPPEVKPVESAKPDNNKRPKPAPEQRSKFEARHFQMMGKMLGQIGVTDEQREQIFELQKRHIEKMKANWKRLNDARQKLSELQDKSAGDAEIDGAIQEVAAAQAEQLTILARNRKEMERILGKEKNDLLMEEARKFFIKHDRRPAAGMPPRPDVPSDPGNEQPVPPGDSGEAGIPP